MNHDQTPKMTRHALERCQEMGIPARLAKGIFRRPAVVRPANQAGRPTRWDRYMVTSDLFPDYAVVVEDRDGVVWVVTVVFRTTEVYDRDGHTFRPRQD